MDKIKNHAIKTAKLVKPVKSTLKSSNDQIKIHPYK